MVSAGRAATAAEESSNPPTATSSGTRLTEFGSETSAFYQYEDYTAQQLPYLWLLLRNILIVTVIAFNLVGDALRDSLDVRLRRR